MELLPTPHIERLAIIRLELREGDILPVPEAPPILPVQNRRQMNGQESAHSSAISQKG
jgi:hypothetical protein